MAAAIGAILNDWEMREISPDGAPAPAITITATKNGYSRTSEWLVKPAVYSDPVNAACDFLVDAFKCYLADNPSLLCLHGAAVDFGPPGRPELILFPSTYQAGKSTLAVHLAVQGRRIWGDDVLYITEGERMGMAAGTLPRLRLPLPEDGGEAFSSFVESRRGSESGRFLYLNLKGEELAGFGDRAPIRRIVELKRDAKASMELAPAKSGEILKRTILQNFSNGVPALEILDRLYAVVENAECHTLVYANGADAARLLTRTFAG